MKPRKVSLVPLDEQKPGDGRSGDGGGPPVTEAFPGQPEGGGHPVTDRVVFGVTAVLTLAFVLWGSLATDSLEDVSSDALPA